MESGGGGGLREQRPAALTNVLVRRVVLQGWNQESWDEGASHPTDDWLELTAEERTSAETLGHSHRTWNKPVDGLFWSELDDEKQVLLLLMMMLMMMMLVMLMMLAMSMVAILSGFLPACPPTPATYARARGMATTSHIPHARISCARDPCCIMCTPYLHRATFYHHDKNRRRNEHERRGISVTALVLITMMKACLVGGWWRYTMVHAMVHAMVHRARRGGSAGPRHRGTSTARSRPSTPSCRGQDRRP
jgi:hypothetical protein